LDTALGLSLIGNVVGAVSLSIQLVPMLTSKSFRRQNHIPDIRGTWDNEWFVDGRLYSNDSFVITRWIRDGRFEGKGTDTKGEYNFEGEVLSRSVLAGYRDARFPNNGRLGAFILNLEVDGKKMTGQWHGLTVEGKTVGGEVICVLRKQPAAGGLSIQAAPGSAPHQDH
jgi:hypothetical protein